jgi:hypothetical protein
VTGEIEVTLTEEFETTMAAEAETEATASDDADGQAAVIEFAEAGDGEAGELGLDGSIVESGAAVEGSLAGAARVQHASRERGRARELFERLSALPEGDQERQRIRGELVELHLPLVEYLARRFRNRGSTT